jgi:iron complex outermembrane recepter protein
VNIRPYGSKVSVAVAMALGLTAQAWSQNGSASGTAAQQPQQPVQLNEIIVTAQRVAQRALDVPISMTVFNQQQLANRNIVTAGDLSTYTPSLSIDNQFGSDFTSFGIRGFSQALQTTPSVAVYFADAVTPRSGDVGFPAGDGAGPGDFFDLENVQVLKGPQGTLFGLNTTGGAVLLVPKRPTSDFGGYVEGTYGNFGLNREQAVVNLPVSDALRVRLGVDHESQNGYLDNISGVGPSRFGNIDYTAARLSAVLDITPDIETYAIANYTLSIDNGPLWQLFACNPSVGLGSFCVPQLARMQGGDPYAVANGTPGAESYLRQTQIIDTTTWQASDNLTVKNIFNYGQLRTDQYYDVSGTDFRMPPTFPYPTPGGVIQVPDPFAGSTVDFINGNGPQGGTITDQYTVSDELQLHGTALSDRLTWQGGGYVERSAPNSNNTAAVDADDISCTSIQALQCIDVLGTLAGAPGTVGSVQSDQAVVVYKDVAAYGQATYSVTSRLKVTGGLRYTTDWTDATRHMLLWTFPAPDTPVEHCVSAIASLTDGCGQSLHEKSDAPTWLADVQYYLRQDSMLYAKYARGYREGGIDTTGPDGYDLFRPEHVDDFELGEKSSWQGVLPGSFDANLFYDRFTDQQLLVGFEGPLVSPVSDIINAGKSRVYGAELEGSLRPFTGFQVGASYTYLRTTLLQLTPVMLAPGGAYTIVSFPTTAGSSLPQAPMNKLSGDASYTVPLPENLGEMELGATYVYTSKQFVSQLTPYGTLPSYSLLDMNLNWNDIGNSPVDAQIFVTNLANKLYYTNVTQFYYLAGFESRALGEPRMYGLRVRVRFGH